MSHIEVIPNILLNDKKGSTNSKPIDPDVEMILNDTNDNLDIMTLKHKPTKEETNESKAGDNSDDPKPYSWLIIGLSILVIILIIAIVWYVLKDNKKALEIPRAILQPSHPMNNFNHPMHPMNRPQTESLPHNPHFMPRTQTQSNNPKKSNVKNPSKEELLKTLNKLNTIPEEPKIEEVLEKALNKKEKPKERINEKIIKEQEQENDGDDDVDEQDDELAKKFYDKLQQNIDNDDADDAIDNDGVDE
jgi:hypothetical protein